MLGIPPRSRLSQGGGGCLTLAVRSERLQVGTPGQAPPRPTRRGGTLGRVMANDGGRPETRPVAAPRGACLAAFPLG